MSGDYGRRPSKYLSPDPELLPANSVYNHVRVGDNVKPMPHLMRMFKTYVEEKVDNDNDLPTIDYHEFGKKWLALFNYGAHEDHSRIPLMDWVSEVAGNPYKAVRIIRWEGNGYVEVGRVPPIFDRLAPVMKSGDRDYFIGMAAMQSIKHRVANLQNEADGFIERNLTKRVEVNKQLTENFYAMNEVFKLYGVEREIPDWIKAIEGDNVSASPEQVTEKKPTPQVYEMEEDDDW